MVGESRASYWRLAVVATGVLAGLKLAGHLGWPWLGVAAPIWVPLALSVGVRVALLLVVLAAVWWLDPGGVTAELSAVARQVAGWLPL